MLLMAQEGVGAADYRSHCCTDQEGVGAAGYTPDFHIDRRGQQHSLTEPKYPRQSQQFVQLK